MVSPITLKLLVVILDAIIEVVLIVPMMSNWYLGLVRPIPTLE